MKGQDRQQTEQCNGRELEEEVVSKKETGYEARQGGLFPLVWAAAQYQKWNYDQRATTPSLLGPCAGPFYKKREAEQ